MADNKAEVSAAGRHSHGNGTGTSEAAATNGGSHLFAQMATKAAHFAGKPITFLIAAAIVVIWALSGPFFGYSDTWQLVINTSTTIVTFLMVFLIQNTQNRDALAVQLKLAELIMAVHGAKNKIATVEDLSEEELEALHNEYRERCEDTLQHLERKRSSHAHGDHAKTHGDHVKKAS